MPTLSQKDQEILNRIFNRKHYKLVLFCFTLFIYFIADNLFIQTDESNLDEKDEEVSGNLRIKELEIEAVKVAESSDPPTSNSLLFALNLIEKAIEIAKSESHLTNTESISYSLASLLNNKAQILRLLGRDSEALECLNLVLSNPTIFKNKTVLRQASAQRAWLYFRTGDNETAFKDFECAAKLGCLESKRMAVRCNPYAAMCNQMLHEIIGSTFYSK